MELDVNNPIARTGTRRVLAALGLGIGIAGVGATLGDLYRRPGLAVGGMMLGAGVAILHLPWSEWLDKEEG